MTRNMMLTALILAGAAVADPVSSRTDSALLNRQAPDIELKTLEGQTVRLSSFRGRPVLLNFWASWCPSCRTELAILAVIRSEYQSKGLVVLGVNNEGRADALKYAKQNRLPIRTLDDSDSDAWRLYRVRFVPTVFLIDANGKVVRYFTGAHDEETMRAALKAVGL